ncbi:adenosylmethionine--8-amino-7-oxononanoate transaminase [Oleispirillum naphthae]|uniref:adenosylmethionine--8-amino-7-oxononanoate transaminase n=1 Tax=Oleispirillum naphthae TaxID=2838853 RepID=UPI00308225B1
MTSDLLARDRRVIWHPFTQAQTAPEPIAAVKAQGAVITDADGNEILDMISSWWVNLHGHAHPAIADAVAHQAHTLEQVIFATCTHAPAVDLAEGIAALLPEPLTRVFYSDNGSTAVEVAMKMAVQYAKNRGDARRTRFVAMEGAYHGDTVGAMSAGVSCGIFDVWGGMLFSVDTMPNAPTWDGDEAVDAKEAKALAALDAYLAEHGDAVAAAIVEPLVQGAGGMRMCRPAFLKAWTEKLKAAGALVIFDEVMTGFGRLGDLFACLKAQVTPDFVCLSKGITGGFLPMAATVTTEAVYAAFLSEDTAKAFLHGHSYTANPLGCAAGNASLKLLLSPACAQRRAEIEAFHRAALPGLAKLRGVNKPRICGTIAAVSIETGSGEKGLGAAVGLRLKEFFKAENMLIRPLGNVLYLLPPYCITDAQLTRAYDSMTRGVKGLFA